MYKKNLLKQLGDDLRAVQSRVDELDLSESKIADATKELYEGALTKFERRIAREELTRAMETYKITNKGLRKVVNFHAQRMLTHDGYTRNMAEKATNFVTGLYYPWCAWLQCILSSSELV
jgi:chemotaxis methyl-accepting protein methylase